MPRMSKMQRLVGYFSAACAALAICACSATAPRPAPQTAEIISVMDAYWSFAGESHSDAAARRDAFRRIVLAPYPELYGRALQVPGDGDLDDYLTNLAPLHHGMRALETLVLAEIPRAGRELDALTGPAGETVYVAPALFQSNGQVRWIDDRPVVVFGLDVQAWVESNYFAQKGAPDARALVWHELFHARHYRANSEIATAAELLFNESEAPPLYVNLWIEGLASCVSHAPSGADIDRTLMWPGLAEAVTPQISRIAAEMLTRLDETDVAYRQDYFWLGEQRGEFPLRSAYPIGLLAAHHALQSMSLREAVNLRGRALRAAVEGALRKLAREDSTTDWSNLCAAIG